MACEIEGWLAGSGLEGHVLGIALDAVRDRGDDDPCELVLPAGQG